MPSEIRQLWAERAVRILNEMFPDPSNQDFRAWSTCDEYLSHAQTVLTCAQQLRVEIAEATSLHHRVDAYEALRRALTKLPSKYRAISVLRYWHDFSYEEIGAALNLTPALVKARLHRARELLARYMKENTQKEDE